jgi:hypothetical protein
MEVLPVQTSLFLARLMGPVMLLTALGLLTNRTGFQRLAREVMASEALIFLGGVLATTAGLAIVLTHQVWSGWPLVVTLFGWLMLLGGAMRLVMPGVVKSMGGAFLGDGAGARTFWMLASLLYAGIGAYLCYLGYAA